MSLYLLKAENIGLHINRRQILDNISLSINAGEILTLIGPNGSGKTTLVRVLLGLLKADQGTLQKKPDLVIGYVPQKLHIGSVLPMTVQRFLQMGVKVDNAEMVAGAKTLGVADRKSVV